MLYTTVANRCPECGCSFRTLEDEFGQHECPNCGYFPHKTVKCAGCGEVIEPGEDVYVLEDGTITHADWGCLKEAVDPQLITLEEAIQG